MKKISKLFVLFFAVVLLAGCGMKENFNLKIQSDKKVNLEIKILMDDEMIDTMISMNNLDDESDLDDASDKTYTDEERWKYLEENFKEDESTKDYKFERLTEGSYKGYKVVVGPTDIDKITGTGEKVNLAEMDELEDNSLFTKSGDVYTSNITYNMDADEYNLDDYSSQMDFFTITFDVTLPNKSISNNADKVSDDGLTLSWDLSKASNKNIDFSFKFDPKAKNLISKNENKNNKEVDSTSKNTMSIITIGLIAAGVLFGIGIIVLVIVLIVNNSKKKKAKEIIEPKSEEKKE